MSVEWWWRPSPRGTQAAAAPVSALPGCSQEQGQKEFLPALQGAGGAGVSSGRAALHVLFYSLMALSYRAQERRAWDCPADAGVSEAESTDQTHISSAYVCSVFQTPA